MAAIETILERLLVPDNAVIQQATRELQAVYKNPEVIPSLCTLLQSSSNPQIRQFAAVLLRKRLVKLWKKLPDNDRTTIKSVLLQCLTQETVRIVFISVAHLASVLAKYELPRGQWEELSTFIFQYCHSQDPKQREVGLLLLSSVMDAAALNFKEHFQSLFQLLSTALEDPQSKAVPFYALKCLTSMVEYMAEEDSPHFTPLVPKIMVVVHALIAEDEDKACEGMELFDEIVECEVGMVTPHLPDLIQFSLQVAGNTLLGDNIRAKALSFLQWLASLKKKSLLRQGLLPIIIRCMLTIMASPPASGEDGDEEGGGGGEVSSSETRSPISLAAQVLDILSLHLPPEKILTPVLECVEPWLTSENHYERAASLIAVAVMVEGCSQYIVNNHLPALLQIVYKGVRDEQKIVRNAALFAIGQFSEHLQPQIAEYSGELLPILFQFVDRGIMAPTEEASALTKIFYALETFCEQLGPKLVPYLPALMEKLFLALSSPNTHEYIHVKELAISAIGAAANACEAEMLPYFSETIKLLRQYIALPHHQDTLILQAQAIDTLGTLARTSGEVNFRPLAAECVALGIGLMESNDPDLRRSVYGMLASVSCVLKEEMLQQLEPVVSRILQALQSDEGVTVQYASSEVPFLDFDEEEDEEEGEEGGGGSQGEASSATLDDSLAIQGYSVENSYLEEKEDGCNALSEMAENVGPGFIQYIDDCYREANALSEHSHEGIRKAAICAVGQFCRLWYTWLREAGSSDLEEVEYLVNSTVLNMAATARTDSDRNVVGACLETLEHVLKSLKGSQFKMSSQASDSVLVSLHDVLYNKAQCCGTDMEDSGDMSEYDSIVLECAGSVLGPLAAVMGGEAILPSLPQLLSPLINRLKPDCSSSDRSFAIGTIAELLEGLGSHCRKLTELYQLVMKAVSDDDDEVCSNAIYGVGLLMANGLPETNSQYHEVLTVLFTTAQSRRNSRILDNICAAICRMIMAYPQGVPLDQVVPVLLRNLPLKEDMEEVETVYRCFIHLFSSNQPTMMANLPAALNVMAQSIPSPHLSQELKGQLVELLKLLNTHHLEQVQTALPLLPPDHLATLNSALL